LIEPNTFPNNTIHIGSRLELFIDEGLIDRLNGAERRLHHPVPQEVSLVFDQAWEGNWTGGSVVLRADDGLFRLYYRGGRQGSEQYQGYPAGMVDTRPRHVCYAESHDGITWTRPSLGLFEVAGTRDNNVVVTAEHGRRVEQNFSCFVDTRAGVAPEERYKGIGGMTAQVFALVSPDGINWRKLKDEPVIEGYDSMHFAFWDAARGEYRSYARHRRIAAYQAGMDELGTVALETDDQTGLTVDGLDNGRDIITSTSKDFIHWTEPEFLSYSPGRVNELYENVVQPYYRAPHLILGFPMRYIDRGWTAATDALPQLEHRRARAAQFSPREGSALSDAMLMCSRDGKHFSMWPESFIRPGLRPKDNWTYWDNFVVWGMIETASPVMGAPDEMSIFVQEAFLQSGPSRLRRHTLRVDGFVSVCAPLSGGEMLTRPLVFSGSELIMNYSTSAAGSVQVELQDAQGVPLPGFALADSEVMYGDSLEQPMLWRGGPDLRALAGAPVRLRFVLKDADIFSLRFR
jgi:hypothetical protein